MREQVNRLMTNEYDDVSFKIKGVNFIYPGQVPLYSNYPNSQEAYVYSFPYQEVDYYYSTLDGRQFGGHQPPSAPPGHGHDLEPGPPTSPPPTMVPQQAHHARNVRGRPRHYD